MRTGMKKLCTCFVLHDKVTKNVNGLIFLDQEYCSVYRYSIHISTLSPSVLCHQRPTADNILHVDVDV